MGIAKGQPIPVNVCGSSVFGRYPKISAERTYNMYLSDGWLCNYPGFKKVSDIVPTGEGRGIFNSIRGGFLIVVINSTVYRLNTNLAPIPVGTIATITGQVYIDENLSSQICIVDGKKAYIYNYENNTFTLQTLMFIGNEIFPNYVCYHNTFFLFASSVLSPNPQNWYVFEFDTPTTIKLVLDSQFAIQTKPDFALAVKRLPGRGNNVLVLGSSVAEVWTQVGGLENYRRVQSFNIDSGLASVPTLAASEDIICWLSKNENNSPCIMVSDGSSAKRISSDGIDHLLDQIQHPTESHAFFFRQDGHLFYQITFSNPVDNLTLIHDFTTSLFFHASNQNLDFHPARAVVFFNEDTYFISSLDGGIYIMNTDLLTYDYDTARESVGDEIPRIRICKSIRKPNSGRFRVGQFSFWIEQGVNTYYIGNPVVPRVDMSFSKNGNQSFSNIVSQQLNKAAQFRNQIQWWKMGQANEFTIQLRFWGFQRFVCGDGEAQVY